MDEIEPEWPPKSEKPVGSPWGIAAAVLPLPTWILMLMAFRHHGGPTVPEDYVSAFFLTMVVCAVPIVVAMGGRKAKNDRPLAILGIVALAFFSTCACGPFLASLAGPLD